MTKRKLNFKKCIWLIIINRFTKSEKDITGVCGSDYSLQSSWSDATLLSWRIFVDTLTQLHRPVFMCSSLMGGFCLHLRGLEALVVDSLNPSQVMVTHLLLNTSAVSRADSPDFEWYFLSCDNILDSLKPSKAMLLRLSNTRGQKMAANVWLRTGTNHECNRFNCAASIKHCR